MVPGLPKPLGGALTLGRSKHAFLIIANAVQEGIGALASKLVPSNKLPAQAAMSIELKQSTQQSSLQTEDRLICSSSESLLTGFFEIIRFAAPWQLSLSVQKQI